MPGALTLHPDNGNEDPSSRGSRMSETAVGNENVYEPVNWYDRFRHECCEMCFIKLPHWFMVRLLNDNSVYIDFSSANHQQREEEYEWSDGTVTTITDSQPNVEEMAIINQINESIDLLGGHVSPKLSLFCPTDATWTHYERSHRCNYASDILMLCACSERVLNNVVPDNFETESETVLTLRKWDETFCFQSSIEFRLFIYSHTIVAICPRQGCAIQEDGEDRDDLVHSIVNWYELKICHKFSGEVQHLVIDIIINRSRRSTAGGGQYSDIKLIDFAKWDHQATDALLFSWDELESLYHQAQNDDHLPVFRCNSQQGQPHLSVRPAQQMYDGLPLELRQYDTAAISSIVQRLARNEEEEGDTDAGN